MTLGALIVSVPGAVLHGASDPEITGIAYHADSVVPGDAFVCLPGARVDGHDFAPRAVERGAAALVVSRRLPLAVPQLQVPDTRLAMALMAAELAGHPSRALRLVGITGTNGKTTSAFLLHAVLEAAGERCGLIGTVEARVGGQVEPVTHTTPESVDLQATLARMVAAGDQACVMEVSSHALAQSRVAGAVFGAALFTNLTRDHLDYHPTVDAYYLAKRRLFDRGSDGPNPPAASNLDDEFGRRLARELGLLGFAIDDPSADVVAEQVTWRRGGVSAVVRTPRGPIEVESRLRGRFNLENVLGVVAAGELLGLDHEAVASGIASVAGVPGRMEPIEAGQPFEVLVDYAHTPDSLENVLRTARELTDGKLIVVFGCGGDRDRGKRRQMGEIARRLADRTVVTSDNPRSEDPDAIIAEILEGSGPGGPNLAVEPDRRAAITLAIAQAGAGDVVVIAGKGHERGQDVAGVVTPFDDRAVAREVLKERA